MTKFLNSLGGRALSFIALALATVCLLAINLLAETALTSQQIDVSENRLYTLTDATRSVLDGLDEPVTVKLYYSHGLGERAASYAHYFQRVRALLERYSSLAGGKLKLQVIDPQPFSDEEDQAVGAGLRGFALGEGEGTGYFGLVGSNSTDDREVLPFMAIDRQDFLEYDLTRVIHKLADPKRKTVGLLTSLQMAGGVNPNTGQRLPAWLIYEQLSEFFDIKLLQPNLTVVPADVDVLVIAVPEGLTAGAQYAIDQFALAGKPIMLFADPYSEASVGAREKLKDKDNPILKLLRSWGAVIDGQKVVGDVATARRVQFGSAGQPQVAGYVAWMSLDKGYFDIGDPVFSSVERIVFATTGAIEPAPDSKIDFHPLIVTSPEAMTIDIAMFQQPDPLQLLQNYLPGGKRLTLAVRLSGEAQSLFPDGPPAEPKADNKDETAAKASDAKPLKNGEIKVTVVADADMLFDSFWAQAREIAGQQIIIPQANNIDFLLNALESATGGKALSGLRGRGVEDRPFTLVQAIRRQAEGRYRQREQVLNSKLQETQKKIEEIQSRSQGGKVVLTEQDKEAILGFRRDLIAVRRDLREVQRALRSDIEKIGLVAKVANIGGIPLFIAVVAIVLAILRRRRSRIRVEE